jgi:hypothetical protein
LPELVDKIQNEVAGIADGKAIERIVDNLKELL